MMMTMMIAAAVAGIAVAITRMAIGGAGATMTTIAGGVGAGVTMMTTMIERRA